VFKEKVLKSGHVSKYTEFSSPFIIMNIVRLNPVLFRFHKIYGREILHTPFRMHFTVHSQVPHLFIYVGGLLLVTKIGSCGNSFGKECISSPCGKRACKHRIKTPAFSTPQFLHKPPHQPHHLPAHPITLLNNRVHSRNRCCAFRRACYNHAL
jgi:hypothetical protein